MEKLNKKILFLVILSLVFWSFASISNAVQNSSEIEKSDEELEKYIIQQAEEQKDEQLKEYFKDYYYKQGMDYFKKARYEEAIVKFKRALHWDPQYEPAIRYIELTENKITQEQRLQEERKLAEEKKKEAPESVQEKIAETKEEPKERIAEEQKVERLTAQEVVSSEVPSTVVVYRIDKEDLLEISVWRHPELSREVIV